MPLNLLKRKTRPRACVPPGCRVYAIGDIHGRADLLADLHRRIAEDAGASQAVKRIAVYLGDYVDRGHSSFEVIDMLLNEPLKGFESVHLKGNHEAMMLEFIDGTPNPNWLVNGGDATLQSYGIEMAWAIADAYGLERIRDLLQDSVPSTHLAFLRSLQLHMIVGDYLFVHAGIRPGLPLDKQRAADFIWIRDRFLASHDDFGMRVVHGHSITAKPEVRANRIGIDTGAFFSNRLTCAILEDRDVRFLNT